MKACLTVLFLVVPFHVAMAQGEGTGEATGEATGETPPAVQTDPNVKAGDPAAVIVRQPAIKLEPEIDKPLVNTFARHFFAAIILGEAKQLAELSSLPFQLEDKKLSSEEEFMTAWQKALRSRNTGMLTLYGLEIYTAAEMEKKYGKPPARLANFPWKRAGTYTVVANLSGRPAIAVLLKTRDSFAVIGYHD